MNNASFNKKIMSILKDIYKKLIPHLPNLPNDIIILELLDVSSYHGLTELDYFDWKSSSDKKYLISEITKPAHIKVRFYDNDNKQLPLEMIVATFLHEVAHCIAPGVMQRGRDINKKILYLQNEEFKKNKWMIVYHSFKFYSYFSKVLRIAEKLNIFILPPSKNKFSPKKLQRFDACDRLNLGKCPCYSLKSTKYK